MTDLETSLKSAVQNALVQAYSAGREGRPFNFSATVETIFAPEVKAILEPEVAHKLVDYDDASAEAVRKDTY